MAHGTSGGVDGDGPFCNLFDTCGPNSAATKLFGNSSSIAGNPYACSTPGLDGVMRAKPAMLTDTGDFTCNYGAGSRESGYHGAPFAAPSPVTSKTGITMLVIGAFVVLFAAMAVTR
jgi:hypothetical protein